MKKYSLLLMVMFIVSACVSPSATQRLSSGGNSATEAASPVPTAVPTAIPGLTPPALFDVVWADRSAYETSLIEDEQAVLAEMPGASVYHLDLTIADDLKGLRGSQEILYTNTEEVPLNEIYLRLFPNLTGGTTTIESLAIDGSDDGVNASFELEDSALKIELTEPLPPGEPIVLALEYEVEVPTLDGGNYGMFIFDEDILALAHFYPMIAVYDDEGWNLEIAPPQGDVVYADSSFYRVRVSAPEELLLAASGSEIDRMNEDGRQITTYAAGPVRDFYLAGSERFEEVSAQVGDTTIRSYAFSEFEAKSDEALGFAVDSIELFNETIGRYPFSEFEIVSTPTLALGIEYPGVIVMNMTMYDPADTSIPGFLLEGVTVHEVAHQWFYSLIGNDQLDEPWLDESLAQYATLVYYGDAYGSDGYEGFRSSLTDRWNGIGFTPIPIGMPVESYSGQQYSAIVYGRGPLFVETLAEEMGEDTFAAFLLNYFAQHRYGIATTDSFQVLAEEHCGCDLTDLFAEWVYFTEEDL